MPKHIIKQGPLAVYRYNVQVYKYTRHASMVSTLCAFDACEKLPSLKRWIQARRIA